MLSDASIETAGPAALEMLKRLAKTPTAPFHEAGVSRAIRDFCSQLQLSAVPDHYGNLHVFVPGRSSLPPVSFVAHMDHPAYEVSAVEGTRLVGNMLGGLSNAARQPGVEVEFLVDNARVPGRIVDRRGEGASEELLFESEANLDSHPPCAAILKLTDFAVSGDTVSMRAADDLAGCAAILGVLAGIVDRGGAARPVHALFTRAEEVGLVGARLAAEDGRIPKSAVIVSLETSASLPGAEIGSGPVVRTGDRTATFDNGAESLLHAGVAAIRQFDSEFKVQRQLMSGGTCEASAFAAFGYSVTGLAFPLGHYHNGRYEDAVVEEYLSLSDFRSGVRLLLAAATSEIVGPEGERSARLTRRPDAEAVRLRATASR